MSFFDSLKALIESKLQGGVDLNGKALSFKTPIDDLLFLDPVTFESHLLADDETATSLFRASANLAGNAVTFAMLSSDGTNIVQIIGNPQLNTIGYVAATHTFVGKIINPDIVAKNFADDAAAAIGGVAVGEDYHTDGVKKVRII